MTLQEDGSQATELDALFWAAPPEADRRRLERIAALAANGPGGPRRAAPHHDRAVLAWMEQAAERPVNAGYALEALAWAAVGPQLAPRLRPATTEAMLEHLQRDVAEAATLTIASDPLVHQLLAGELAMRLAGLCPQPRECRRLAAAGAQAVLAGFRELLDGRGLPQAHGLSLLQPLLACWTRCRALAAALPGGRWPAAATRQFGRLVQAALRLARPDGSMVFSQDTTGGPDAALWCAAVRLADTPDADRLARLALPRLFAQARRRPMKQRPAPLHNEAAALATVRSDAGPQAVRLTTAYSGPAVQIELACGEQLLFSGVWDLALSLDGVAAVPCGDWDELCWVSDDDADYLELELDFRGGLRVQRHLVFAHADRCVLLADAVLGAQSAAIEYRASWPLAAGVRFMPERETCEGHLAIASRLGRALPLALPEWRAAGGGQLLAGKRQLELRQSAVGRCLFAPLWLDLDRRRNGRPVTWRQLTVGESLAAVPPEVAAGYRVAVGRRQWLVYRALAHKGNRTLLGHNLSTEFLVARFSQDGEVAPLIEIE